MARLKASATFVALGLAVFGLARLALYLLYPEDFASLGWREMLFAFAYGARFDLSVLMLACCLPLMMINMPGAIGRKRAWFLTWAMGALIALDVVLLIVVGDMVYFGEVRRHVGPELRMMSADLDFLVPAAITHPAALAAYLGIVLALGFVWLRAIRIRLDEPLRGFGLESGQLLLVALVLALGIRGTLSDKSLTVADAFQANNYAFGTLSLNGAYSAIRSSSQETAPEVPLSLEDALTELGLTDRPFPVVRSLPQVEPTSKNAVLILLESWDTRYVDCYRDTPLGLTPNFDRMAETGRRYLDFHSTSQRSIGAVQATLTGIGPMPGVPELGFGLELTNFTRLGAIAQSHGYETLMVQAPRRRSYYMDSVSEVLGFRHYYGQEDIPVEDHGGGLQPKFGWDHETFEFALDRIDELDGPFLAVVISGTTHSPYADPGERFHHRPHALQGENGYVNALAYSDWALGQFMDRARTEDWFDDTVFLIGADHPWKASAPDDLNGCFRIPFLLLGATEPGVDALPRSHVDVLPTVMELLGFDEPFATLGTSLLDDSPRSSVVKRGSVLGILSSEGELQHSLLGRLEASPRTSNPEPVDFDGLERELLATYRVTSDLLTTNRWLPAVSR